MRKKKIKSKVVIFLLIIIVIVYIFAYCNARSEFNRGEVVIYEKGDTVEYGGLEYKFSAKIYTLEEAYHAEIDGIEKALEFLNGTTIAMIGDADANFTLNIKDATWIQKSIAKYSDLPKRHEWNELAFDACDFNRDDKINIKDATAIQKHLAKIDY